MDEPETASFTLMDVYRDALESLRATWALHFAWGVGFVLAMIGGCCGVTCLLVPLAMLLGLSGTQTDASAPPPPGLLVAVYVAFAATYFVLFTLHEAVTLEVTHAHARGEVPRIRAAVDASLRRAPALLGATTLRFSVDAVPIALVTSLGAGLLAAAGAVDDRGESARTLVATAVTLAYFVGLAWMLAMRAYFGLALSAVVGEGLGPRAAFERSMRLLRGRRWHFLAFRLSYLVLAAITYCVSFLPLFAFVALVRDRVAERDPDAGLAMIPGLGIVYAVVLALFALDAILVATYHARLARRLDASEVAKVFE